MVLRSLLRWGARLLAAGILLGVAAFVVLAYAPERLRTLLSWLGQKGDYVSALLPPILPPPHAIEQPVWLDQNWSDQQSAWFHNVSQGTATFPVPYSWFKALERPELNLGTLTGSPGHIADPDYLARLGFIPSRAKGELPVGFALLKSELPGFEGEGPGLGLTCAACHIGHLSYGGLSLNIDGGPAMIDLELLELVIGHAICYTDVKIFWLRRHRFVEAVLDQSPGLSPEERTRRGDRIRQDLTNICAEIQLKQKREKEILTARHQDHTDEGFGRLDALNRIGNRVFYENLGGGQPHGLTPREWEGNFAARNAPVSFPPIWDVPHFSWAQYDASIFNPLIRNVGEAMGVSAIVNMTDAKQPFFRSSVDLPAIAEVEEALGGEKDPLTERRFNGLAAPKWSDAAKLFPSDKTWNPEPEAAKVLARNGRELYRQYCVECHRGPVRDSEFGSPDDKDSFWRLAATLEAGEDARSLGAWIKAGNGTFFSVIQKRIVDMGTDSEQGRVLTERQVRLPAALTVDPIVDLNQVGACGIPNDPALAGSYALNLMAVVARTQKQWLADNHGTVPPVVSRALEDPRPNCPNPLVYLLAQDGEKHAHVQPQPRYRARPLDGVWATAPYLHNGSVPTLLDLLKPQAERPTHFCIGTAAFDPANVGLARGPDHGEIIDRESGVVTACATGLTLFKAEERGNANLGHSFEDRADDKPKVGVIGPKFDDDQRQALIAYLKTL